MSARWVQGNARLGQGFPVATAQAVARMDMVGLQSNTVVRAQDTTWASAIAAPGVFTGADSTVALSASGLAAAATLVKISYQFPWGEGPLSASVSVTPTAHAAILLTGTPLLPPAPALWTNVYTNDASGGTVYKLAARINGNSFLLDHLGLGPSPNATTTGALDVTQYNFAQSFLGCSNQDKLANVARIFGSSRDNTIMVCRGEVIEFDCASASFNVGDYVGPDKDVGSNLLNQQVVAVASEGLAIGRVLYAATSVTKVMVELLSRYVPDLQGPPVP